jgi:hypothetical protein
MPELTAIAEYRLADHALTEMARRQITAADVTRVLSAPEQAEADREDRVVYQSRVEMGDPPKVYLLRVFVDVDRHPPDVVTVYRTGKIARYWSKS